jgi:hypothetical protein
MPRLPWSAQPDHDPYWDMDGRTVRRRRLAARAIRITIFVSMLLFLAAWYHLLPFGLGF